MNNQDIPPEKPEKSHPSLAPATVPPENRPPSQAATADQLANVEKQMTGFEKATLRWATIAAVMSFVAAIFICAQWYEMHIGSEDTHTLAEAAKRQADKAETISNSIQQAVDAMKTANSQARDSFDKTVKQSTTALDATISASHLDQRAWVAPVGIRNLNFKAGEPVAFTVIFENSGKSPALHERHEITGQSIPRGGKIGFSYGPIEGIKSSTTIQPGMRVTNTTLAVIHRPTQQEIHAIESGDAVLYLYGRIFYDDIFRVPHHTTFCYVVDPDLVSTQVCDKYNEAD